jgi:hypothetical protein
MTPMETPLTVPQNYPRNKQGRKLYYRVLTAAKKSGRSVAELQPALEQPGTGMDDELAAVLVKYSKRALGIYTPVRAHYTGLVPDGYAVESDDLEGDVNVANLDFNTCLVREGDGDWMRGDPMRVRAKEVQAIGSLGFGKIVLDAQKEGKNIIPIELRDKAYIILPRTVLRDRDCVRYAACLDWISSQWVPSIDRLDQDFSRGGRFVRELPFAS